VGLFGKDNETTVIDLTVTGGETESETGAESGRAKQVWGGPGPCPECTGRGYLDRIDIRARVMYQHCIECGHSWSISEEELATQA
jgi:hypothetical protein